MNIDLIILSILKTSKDVGNGMIQLQNLERLLGRKGRSDYTGYYLTEKLQELIGERYVGKENLNYSITEKGLKYLEENVKE